MDPEWRSFQASRASITSVTAPLVYSRKADAAITKNELSARDRYMNRLISPVSEQELTPIGLLEVDLGLSNAYLPAPPPAASVGRNRPQSPKAMPITPKATTR